MVNGARRPRGAINLRDAPNLLRAGGFLLLVVENGDAGLDLYNGPLALTAGDAVVLTALEPFVFSTPGSFSGVWIDVPVWWLIERCHGHMTGARRRMAADRAITVVLRDTISILLDAEHGAEETDDLVDLFGDVLARNLMAGAPDGVQPEGQISRIHRFVSSNFRTAGVSPRDAARELGCSVSSIHKSCASVGQTFGGLLTGWRLSVAAHRLSRMPQSVSEVAFDCGFISLPHFCRAFKSRYGVTPSSVRRQHAVGG